MVDICLYFQVHQPFRMRSYNAFEIGKSLNYFDHEKNMEMACAIAGRSYVPAAQALLNLIKESGGKFRIALGISGVALEQFEGYNPEVIDCLRELASTGCVEFVTEPYHHSFSFLYSKKEFLEQVDLHKQKMRTLLGAEPVIFRNSELLFNNELAALMESVGFTGILANGAQHILGWRSPDHVYTPSNTNGIRLLLKNVKLSEDLEHRFSGSGAPMTAEAFATEVCCQDRSGPICNLFLSYETLGERHRKGSGIFRFLRKFPEECFRRGGAFATPSEIIENHVPAGELDVLHPTVNNNLDGMAAYLGNNLQHAAMNRIYSLEGQVKAAGDPALLDAWRKLQSTDHLHSMSTATLKGESPYDSFITFMNILNDMSARMDSGARVEAPLQKEV